MSETTQDVNTHLATIIESCSTNTVGYSITVRLDGSATAQIDGRLSAPPQEQEFPAGAIDAKKLQSLLAAVGDVSKIPTGFCLKPVSFATTTKILYNGKTSGDLQAFSQNSPGFDPAQLQADANLCNFVKEMQKKLNIPVMCHPVSDQDLAVVSGSTNDCTFNVAIHQDGSGTGSVCFKTHALVEKRDYPAGTFATARLRHLFTRIGDVSGIPIETIEVACAGKMSGNLRSVQQHGSGFDQKRLQASMELANLLQAAVSQHGLAGETMASSAHSGT